MKLSEKIFNKNDFKPAKGLLGASAGYDAKDVDGYLDEVVQEVEKLETENENLQIQVHNLLEEKRVDGQVEKFEGDEELTTLKERLVRTIEQTEFFERANKKMYVEAEKVCHQMKVEAEKQRDVIIEDANERANSMMQKAEERKAEIEREIQLLINKEKEMREKFSGIVKLAETVVNN